MSVFVDTNVISDVIYNDPVWRDWSKEQLARHAGQLRINPIIFSELCVHAQSADEVEQLVIALDLQYEELPRLALFLAAQAFRIYRQRGGSKTASLPDFFIGAHAQAVGVPILTRDTTRYQTYFPTVRLISP